jgi:hypothetical protein
MSQQQPKRPVACAIAVSNHFGDDNSCIAMKMMMTVFVLSLLFVVLSLRRVSDHYI